MSLKSGFPHPKARKRTAQHEDPGLSDRMKVEGGVERANTRFRAAGYTSVGQVRKNNEDFGVIESFRHGADLYHLLLVADGMGGGVKGEVASELASAHVKRYVLEESWQDPHAALDAAFRAANAAVFDRGTGGGEAPRSLMGTTLVVAIVSETTGKTWVTHAGDARAYRVRGGAVEQLTADHSIVAEQVRMGALTEAEARRADNRNVVTRAIGTDSEVEPEPSGPFELLEGDMLLLCSDGLHGMVPDARIATIATRNKALEEATKDLVAEANAQGGPDNITVVVGAWGLRATRRSFPAMVLPAIAVLGATLLVCLLFLVWVETRGRRYIAGDARSVNESIFARATRLAEATPESNATPSPPASPTGAIPARKLYSVVAGQVCSTIIAERYPNSRSTIELELVTKLNGLNAECGIDAGQKLCLPTEAELQNPSLVAGAVQGCPQK